jgi:putative SOS response-associated peptidase YedK
VRRRERAGGGKWRDQPSSFTDIGREKYRHTVIITNLASKIHDRMPVLLQPNDFDRWLAGTGGTELLKPAPYDYLQTWPVSRRVNSSLAPGDDPTLIERVGA